MTAAPALDEPLTAPEDGRPPSEYARYMPMLRDFAALPAADPRRPRMRDELIIAFLPVVEHLAHRMAGRHPGSIEDLTQSGTVALIRAIDRWDPALAHGEFLGYLVPCVRGEMLRWFRDRTWSLRVPRSVKDLSVEIDQVIRPLSDRLGRSPRPSELAAELGVEVDEVVEALHAKANQHAGTLDVVDAATGRSPLDRLGSVDRGVDGVEARHLVWPLLDRLPDRERTILILRFFGELTQTQIAAKVGLSQMHVSRLLQRSLHELRTQLPDDVLAV